MSPVREGLCYRMSSTVQYTDHTKIKENIPNQRLSINSTGHQRNNSCSYFSVVPYTTMASHFLSPILRAACSPVATLRATRSFQTSSRRFAEAAPLPVRKPVGAFRGGSVQYSSFKCFVATPTAITPLTPIPLSSCLTFIHPSLFLP
jgi:hypothetical protein